MDILNEAKKFLHKELNEDAWEFFAIADAKGQELAKKLNADKDIVLLGTLLMDVKLRQAMQENRIADHVQMSVDASRKFLGQFNLKKEVFNNVLHCVEAHHGTMPYKTIEAEICANADCYKFLHPKGFFIYLTMLGKRHPAFKECIDQAEKKMEEKYNILSLDIAKSELEKYYQTLKGYINEARKI